MMSGKRWLGMVLAALLLVFVVWALFNDAVDPFKAFGDRVVPWDSYSLTLNPRNSKAVYISDKLDEFDAYVIGSSSAASFLPEVLDAYTGHHYYNMFHYGADSAYDLRLAAWLLEQDPDVKQLCLVLGLNEANLPETKSDALDSGWYPVSGESRASYWAKFLFASPHYSMEKLSSLRQDTLLPQAFDVFVPEDGTYDKRVRDVEPIGSLEDYLALHGGDFPTAESAEALTNISPCAEAVGQIRALCAEKGVELLVVLAPVSESQLSGYTDETLNEYYTALSQVTDYWNFQITPLTFDARYFYDDSHTRNDTIRMVLDRVFAPDDEKWPAGFGVYCQQGSPVSAETLRTLAAEAGGKHTETVPILMYHHFVADPGGESTLLSTEAFAHQMRLLLEAGYHPVAVQDLIDYVDRGTPLPERPVLITMDDGYLSNYTEAYPVLRELHIPATIFAIGCSIGHEKYYKDTEFTLTPHFGQAEIQEFLRDGLVSVQSHTYDMHQEEAYESHSPVRSSIVPFEEESQEDYAAALRADIQQQNEVFQRFGLPAPNVLAFPRGYHETITDVILKEAGYRCTLTTDESRVNTIVQGLPQSLIDLGRINVGPETTDEQILAYLSRTAD